MKQIFVFMTILSLCLLSTFSVCGEELPWEFSSEVGEMTKKIISMFPKIEVYVVSLDDEKIILDNAENNLSVGMTLSVFKMGKKYTHPVTGKVLGHTEGLTAKIQVKEVQNSLAIADIVKKIGKVERGQKARITSSRLRLLLPDIKNSFKGNYSTDAFHSLIVTELEESGRFDVISMVDIYYAMKKYKVQDMRKMQDHSLANKVAVDLKADVLMECELKDLGKFKFIEYKIFVPGMDTVLARNSVKIRQYKASSHTANEEKTVIYTKETGISDSSNRSQKLDYEIVGVQMGDVTGNGKFEVITTDGSHVRVYERTESNLKLIWEESGSHSKQISIDVIDLNKNGIDEIYVTRYKRSPRAYAIEYNDGEFVTTIEDFPRFLRVMTNGKERSLYGQKMSGISVFSGTLEKYEYKENEDSKPELSVVDYMPVSRSIYGCALGKVMKDNDEKLIYYNTQDRLQVYNVGNKRLWESSERFGGTNLKILAKSKTSMIVDDRYGLLSDTGGKGKTWIKPRILVYDTNANGIPEIIVYKNISLSGRILPNTPIFDKSIVYGLEYDGIGFRKKWFTQEVDAVTADFDLVDMEDGSYQLVVGLVLKNLSILDLSSSKSIIVFYNVGED